MDLIAEIMSQVQKEKHNAFKERGAVEVEEIQIHPEWFYKILSDPKANQYVVVGENNQNKLCGIPLALTKDVEKWTIII